MDHINNIHAYAKALYTEVMQARHYYWEQGATQTVIALTDFACVVAPVMQSLGLFDDEPAPERIENHG